MTGSKNKRWLNVSLSIEEKRALIKSAAAHKRTVKQQAAVHIVNGLTQDGLLGNSPQCQCPHCGRQLTDAQLADTLGVDPQREVNQ